MKTQHKILKEPEWKSNLKGWSTYIHKGTKLWTVLLKILFWYVFLNVTCYCSTWLHTFNWATKLKLEMIYSIQKECYKLPTYYCFLFHVSWCIHCGFYFWDSTETIFLQVNHPQCIQKKRGTNVNFKYTNPAYPHFHFCKQKLTAPPSLFKCVAQYSEVLNLVSELLTGRKRRNSQT